MSDAAVAAPKFALHTGCGCSPLPIRAYQEAAQQLRGRLGALDPALLNLPILDYWCRICRKHGRDPLVVVRVGDLLGYG